MKTTSKKVGRKWVATLTYWHDAGGEIKLESYCDDLGHFDATAYYMYAQNAKDRYRKLKSRAGISLLLEELL